MIKPVTYKINISGDKVKDLEVFTYQGTFYNKLKSELTFAANCATGKGFRLIHNSKIAFGIIEGSDKDRTVTIHNIEEANTRAQAIKLIGQLGLEWDNEGEDNDYRDRF